MSQRPPGVPLAASFSTETHEWAYGSCDSDGKREGVWRFHREDGALHRVSTYDAGERHGAERHYGGDQVIAELHYDHGVLHGPYWCHVQAATYALRDLRTASLEMGAYDRGVRAGSVRFLDADDREIDRYAMGSPISEQTLAAGVLSMFPRSLGMWLDLADRAAAEDRIDEVLVCVARAVAKGADRALLADALANHCLPTTRVEAERRADAMLEETSARVLLGALIGGAEPVAILRRLAAVTSASVGLDMIEAAIAIAPDPSALIFSRGLLRVLAGNVFGARSDARTLRHARAAEYELLMDAIRALDDTATKAPALRPLATRASRVA